MQIALFQQENQYNGSLEQKKQLILCVLLNYSTVSNLAIDTDGSGSGLDLDQAPGPGGSTWI